MLEYLQNDHNGLTDLLARTQRVLEGEAPERESESLGTLRWRFKRLLSRHLAFMEAVVFPAARKAAPPEAIIRLDQLAHVTQALGKGYQRHVGRFRARSENLQRPDYLASVQALIGQTRQLIEVERIELYPLLPGVRNPISAGKPAEAAAAEADGASAREQESATMLRLFYTSESLIGRDAASLNAIMVQARTNNAIDGVTGLLWTDGRRFAQVLEGQKTAVTDLMLRLLADPRHNNLKILDPILIDQRQFGEWTMVQPAIEPLAELYERRVKRFLAKVAGPVGKAFQDVINGSRPLPI